LSKELSTSKKLIISVILFITLVSIDQYIKDIFVHGFVYHTKCISLILAYNPGVAFSMFAFLQDNLKFIQIGILSVGIIYLLLNRDVFSSYYLPITLILSGGISNITDRFIHSGGVVDYVYWHCGFDFAIFNFADVIIDLGVVVLIYVQYKMDKQDKQDKINKSKKI
jgi:signal peptidase II